MTPALHFVFVIGILVGSTLAGSAFRLPFVPDRSSCAPALGLWSSIHAEACALTWTYFIFSKALVLRCGLTQPLGFISPAAGRRWLSDGWAVIFVLGGAGMSRLLLCTLSPPVIVECFYRLLAVAEDVNIFRWSLVSRCVSWPAL